MPSLSVICSADFHLAKLKEMSKENMKTLILSSNFSDSGVYFEGRKILLNCGSSLAD